MHIADWAGAGIIILALIINLTALVAKRLPASELRSTVIVFLINCFILFLLISAARGGA